MTQRLSSSATQLLSPLANRSATKLILLLAYLVSAGVCEDELQPSVRMVGGRELRCSESASVLLEYETWHLDPAAEGYSVSMTFYHTASVASQPISPSSCDEAVDPGADGARAEGFAREIGGQRLMAEGPVPSGSVTMSRLAKGFYLVEVELFHEEQRISSTSSLLEVTTGSGNCMRQSIATEYCDHETVDALVRAVQAPEAAGLFEIVEFQTLKSYISSVGNLLSALNLLRDSDVFFVEIGACDGKFADPLYQNVQENGWKGLLVEPLPDVFELLQQNYQGVEGLSFENGAIVEEGASKKMTMKRVPLQVVREMEEECKGKPDEGMCRYAIGVGTLKNDEHSHWILKEKGVDQEVNCLTLKELLDKHKVAKIDIFQVDTEGYDAQILLQLDLSKFQPLLIQIEADHLDPGLLTEVLKKLAKAGYRVLSFGGDLAAFQPQLLSTQPQLLSTQPQLLSTQPQLLSTPPKQEL